MKWVTAKTFIEEGFSFQKSRNVFIISYQGEFLGNISKKGKVDFMYRYRGVPHYNAFAEKAKLILISHGLVKP